MNEAAARAVKVHDGFEGQFRKVHRSQWFPVQVNGVTQVYDTAEQATIAAYQELLRHIFGDGIVRTGEKASPARSEAEKLFGKVIAGKSRKPVEVVRR